MSRTGSKCSSRNTSPTYVRSVAVNEKSTLESVVDFVTDVVPQSTASNSDKEQILWVKFEQLTHPPIPNANEDRKDSVPTTLIIIGYANGTQIWQMLPNGDAQELISMRQGAVKVFSILHRYRVSESAPPSSEHLIVSADSAKPGAVPYSNLKLTPLLGGETAFKFSFKSSVNDVHSNSEFLFVTFSGKILAYKLSTLSPAFTITGCFPGEGPNSNPISVGSSWLAYADSKLVNHAKSYGEVNTEASLSYTATVLNTAKNVAKGVTNIGETLFGSFTSPQRSSKESSSSLRLASGVVTVIDCSKLEDADSTFELTHNHSSDGVICHFQALPNPVTHLKFDYSGTLLFTACTEGQNFHIYKILSDVNGSRQASVQHLYVLHRGDTSAQVMDATFSIDSRWIGVCTARGTTHVFPINPYGGKCTARTHTSQYVVNKATKYQKSAGLDEFTQSRQLRSATPPLVDSIQASYLKFNSGSLENSRLKGCTIEMDVGEPLVQIKQSVWSAQRVIHKHIPNKNIAALFVPSHGRTRNRSLGARTKQARESLYIIGDSADLFEYILDPHCVCEQEKMTDTTELRLSVTARSRWPLARTHSDKDRNSFSCSRSSSTSLGCQKGNSSYGSKESISSDISVNEFDQQWLSQVEIVTYSGPNRRLWMGPQFKFKTYNSNSIVASSHSPAVFPLTTTEIQATADIICDTTDLDSLQINHRPTTPITMPSNYRTRQTSGESVRPRTSNSLDEIFIEAGSFDPSPHMTSSGLVLEAFEDAMQYPNVGGVAGSHTSNLLAEAMQDQRISTESLNSRDLIMFPPG